jgi:hypothetical protein
MLSRLKALGGSVRGRAGSAFGRLRQRGGQFAYQGGRRVRAASVLGRRAIGRKVRGGLKPATATARMFAGRVNVAARANPKRAGIVAAASVLGLGGASYLVAKRKERP